MLELAWEKTGTPPPALLRKPNLTPDLHLYVEAFYTLSGFRAPGFSGPGPLLFADILAYARLVGYTTVDEQLFFVSVIQAADGAFQEYAAKKSKAETAKSKAKPSRPRSR